MLTGSDIRAHRAGHGLRFGGIRVNAWGVQSEHFEQGGFEQGGSGLLRGPGAIAEFQNLKTHTTAVSHLA